MCIEVLTDAINIVIEDEEICETWKHCKTATIPKTAHSEVIFYYQFVVDMRHLQADNTQDDR